MKLRRWSNLIAWMTAVSLAACIALLVFNAGLLPVIEAYREVWSEMAFSTDFFQALAPFLVLFLLVAITVASLILGWVFERKVMRPLERAIAFAEAMAKSEKIPALALDDNPDEDMEALLTALNVLHDRQQNLVARAHQSVAHQLKMNRERDRFEGLKQATFGEVLSEVRRSLGILKGQWLAQEDAPSAKLWKKSIRRQSALAREIEQLFDINRLDWKRWNSPLSARFDTADFIHELLENARLLSRTREVSLVSRLSTDVPGRLFADRELLMQLLGILLRTACRAAEPRSEVFFGGVRDERGEAVFEILFTPRGGVPAALANGADASTPDLEIVRLTAEIIGCAMELRNEKDQVVFRLSLPTGSSLFDAAVSTVLPARPGFPAAETTSAERECLRVLLLDDDDDGIEVLSLIMRRYGIEMTPEKTEEAALERLGREKFDALVVTSPFADCAPGELLEKIGARGRCPVIFVSPKFPEAVRRQLEMHDRVFWMTMPLHYELLDEVIRHGLRRTI
ncbi:MAG: hypothetical protein MJ016_07830 [Victivallaceae bacterium]|nr:hypothetical protein [Victivallaceae bacterium]